MKIYLILQQVDLGTHVNSAWKNKGKATLEAAKLNKERKKLVPWMDGKTFFVKELELQ